MSEPRHVWMTPTGHTGVYIEVTPDYPGAMRRTLTEGPEWTALMERARKAVDPLPTLEQVNTMDNAAFDAIAEAVSLVVVRQALRDLLAYFGEQA